MSDDDNPELSTSDSGKYAEASRGHLKALEREMKHRGKELAAKPMIARQNELKLSVLKNKVDSQKDEEQKRRKQEHEKSKRSIGTKTREQEIERNKLDGSSQINGDLLVEQGGRSDKAKDEMQKGGEVQQNPA